MTRKQHSAQFKVKVVVEAIRGVRPVNELASRFGVHPTQIAHWKKQALEGLPEIFANRRGTNGKGEEALQEELYQQIGRLKVELEWLKKKVGTGRLSSGAGGSIRRMRISASGGSARYRECRDRDGTTSRGEKAKRTCG